MKRIWYWRIFGAGITLLAVLLLSLLWCGMPPVRAFLYAGGTAVGAMIGTFGVKRRPAEDREANEAAFALFPLLKWILPSIYLLGLVAVLFVLFTSIFGKESAEVVTHTVAWVLMIASNLLVYRFGLDE